MCGLELGRADFVSRFFAPAISIDEDPVTGSAHCCLAPYWTEKLKKEPGTVLVAQQVRIAGAVEALCGFLCWHLLKGSCPPPPPPPPPPPAPFPCPLLPPYSLVFAWFGWRGAVWPDKREVWSVESATSWRTCCAGGTGSHCARWRVAPRGDATRTHHGRV